MTEPTTAAPLESPPPPHVPDAPPAAIAPADVSLLAPIVATSPSEVPALIARARAAQAAWARRKVSARAKLVLAVRDRLLDRAEALARTVNAETGKPEIEALLGEVVPGADAIDYWTESIEELLDVTDVELDKTSYPGKVGSVYREARGVVALVTPWNYPVSTPFRTIVPALLAGNAVVWKPSELAPRTGQSVYELFDGLVPKDVFILAQGGADVGEALAAADVDLVVFTGTTASGRKVAHACAERVSPCVLELGGKDAAIVLADANVERAASGVVWGALTNAGQSYASIERVYVESAIAKPFIDKVVLEVKALRPGIDLGPVKTETRRDATLAKVSAASAAGARVLVSGETKGLDLPPMVVQVDDDASALMRDETFGPVVPIAVVSDAEEAVRRANASRFGLTASVWTRNHRRAEEIAHRLRAGVVTINNHAFTAALPAAPWGGRGESGYGSTNSAFALESLTRPRFILVDHSRRKRELWWYPYDPIVRTIALSLIALKSGSTGIFKRIAALFRLLVSLPRR